MINKAINQIVDLSIAGLHLYDGINTHLDRSSRYKRSKEQPAEIDNPKILTRFDSFKNLRYSEPARIIHKSIVDDLVAFLNIPPDEALRNVEELKQFSFFHDVAGLIKIPEQDVFVELLKPFVLKMYLRIQEQFHPCVGVFYTSHEIGLDYVVVRTHSVCYPSKAR